MMNLRIILRIARTDLAVLFYSPIAWFIWIVFSFLTSMDFVTLIEGQVASFGSYRFFDGSMSYHSFLGDYGFFSSIISNLYIYIPLLTMGLISREIASGSIKLAYSSPITSGQLVLGKFLAAITFGLCLMLIPILSAVYGSFIIPSFDWAPILVALFGLYLLICSYCAIGLFMSSLTAYQVVAAIGTLAVLAALRFVGNVGQEYDFIRDITYWLSLNGRTSSFLTGVVRSEDIIYFIVVIALFLIVTTLKLSFERRTLSHAKKCLSYAGVVIASLAIGYFISRPFMIKVWDATRTKENSLTQNSKNILSELKGPVTITNYVNLLDNKSYSYLPITQKANETLFEPYCLAKPDIKVRYVYYYDIAPNGIGSNPKFKGKTIEELRDYAVMVYNLNPHLFKSPEDMHKIIDLSGEQNSFVRVLETQEGKRAYIRDFQDMQSRPSEAEISAAIKKLVSTPPVVAYIKGDGEREVAKSGDRDYSSFSVEKYSRTALINQGFDICELNLSHGDTISNDINIVVLAEMKQPFSEEGMKQIEAYIARGGNLFILTDVGRQEVMNPFLAKLGIRMEENQLVQISEDFAADLILAKATPEANELTFGFKDDFQRRNLKVSMPGCVSLETTSSELGFQYIPVLKTESKGVWIEKEQKNVEETPVQCNELAGEVEKQYVTAYALLRNVGKHEQRILVCGDADCMSNAELQVAREGYNSGNSDLIIESFRWLSGGNFPIDVRRPKALDNRFLITSENIASMKTIFMVIIPAILIFIGVGIWFVRRRN